MLDQVLPSPLSPPLSALLSAVTDSLQPWPNHPFALAMALPTLPDVRHPAFHSRWHDPDADITVLAGGPCWPVQSDEQAMWQSLGHGPAPFMLFQRPFAGTAPIRLTCPAIQCVEQDRQSWLILTADGRLHDSHTIMAVWQRTLLDLSQPGRHSAVFSAPAAVVACSTPDHHQWCQRVQQAQQALTHGPLRKLVLSRRLDLTLPQPVAAGDWFHHLCQQHPRCCIVTLPLPDGHLVAASPERLVVKRGQHMTSHALAGTIRRGQSPEHDHQLAHHLLHDPKERLEHDLVVRMIAATLRQLCQHCDPPPPPHILTLTHLQHLWTPVSGWLRPHLGLLDAVAALHPTPAVAGSPPQDATAWLQQHDEQRGEHYTGVVGWLRADGDGDGVVVLRCAEVRGPHIRLWAGAGIVPQSDPEQEWQETQLKLSTLLQGLCPA